MKVTFKRMAVTVAALSTISIGTAFASMDAGSQLQSWYQGVFNQAKNKSISDLVGYSHSLQPGLKKEQNKLIQDTNQRILYKGNLVKFTSTGKIYDHFVMYESQLQDKGDYLLGQGKYIGQGSQIEKDFNQYINQKNTEVNQYIDDQADLFVSEVTGDLDEIVTETAGSLNHSAKEAASELKEIISDSKAELEELLKEQKEASTEIMKKNLDQQISAKKAEILKKTAELEVLQVTSIHDKGSKLELDAKESMLQEVAKINS